MWNQTRAERKRVFLRAYFTDRTHSTSPHWHVSKTRGLCLSHMYLCWVLGLSGSLEGREARPCLMGWSGVSYSALEARTATPKDVMERTIVVNVLWSICRDDASYSHLWRTWDAVVWCPLHSTLVVSSSLPTASKCFTHLGCTGEP